MAEEYDYLFKSIVVGDGGVGKTALTLRFSKGFFTEDYKMTIGVDFHVKTISIDTAEGAIKCKLQLWDTGGQERFSSIRPMYYRGALGVVLVYDVTNSASFDHLPQWIEEVRANIKVDVPILLVGNKSDLADQRAVTIEEINNFTRDFNLYYMETSAKTGDGVGDCFYILACLMIGSDVPEQLIGNKTVFNPGDILIEASTPSTLLTPELESDLEYSAPPVPEPAPIDKSELSSIKEPEEEYPYEAPPVPEPSTAAPLKTTPLPEPEEEYLYEAPPVPEPSVKKESETLPTFEEEVEPAISIPEPIDFKTPEEILSQKEEGIIKPPLQDISESISGDGYKPKNVPFSSTTPLPAPVPEEFKQKSNEETVEARTSTTPFRLVKKEEPPKPKPAAMTFSTEAEPPSSESKIIFQPSEPSDSQRQSDSLFDYMPQTIEPKKEKKKKGKEKKKKKKKKEKQVESVKKAETPSLFQTLTQRLEETENIEGSSFVPFFGAKDSKPEHPSTLRIIPNVADIESESIPPTKIKEENKKSTDLIICEQCGAILSSDYAFCNKCGNKL